MLPRRARATDQFSTESFAEFSTPVHVLEAVRRSYMAAAHCHLGRLVDCNAPGPELIQDPNLVQQQLNQIKVRQHVGK